MAMQLPGRNPRPLENEVLRACLRWLQLRGVFAWRSNNLPVFDRKRGCYRKHIGVAGLSDISMVLPNGVAGFVEVKRPGEQPSEEQIAFGNKVRCQGGVWIVAHDVDELAEQMEEYLG